MIVHFTVPERQPSFCMKPRRRFSWHSQRSGNNRRANKFLSYDNYFEFSNCARFIINGIGGVVKLNGGGASRILKKY